MISLDKAVIARYDRDGLSFEVYVEPEKARQLKEGQTVPVDDVIVSRDIYCDAKKGKRASDGDMNKIFGTNDFEKILLTILKDGEIQLTTEQKRKMQEEKRKQVMALIARGAVDPQTHMPHPLQRIEIAMEETKVHIDPMKSAESQVETVLSALKPILPIRMETSQIEVHVPASQASRTYGLLKGSNMKKSEWQKDGSLLAVVEMPAGQQESFMDKLHKMTGGNVQTKVLGRE